MKIGMSLGWVLGLGLGLRESGLWLGLAWGWGRIGLGLGLGQGQGHGHGWGWGGFGRGWVGARPGAGAVAGTSVFAGGYKDATKARNHRKLNVGVTIPIVSSLIEDTRPLKAPA